MNDYFLSDEAYDALIQFAHNQVPDTTDEIVDYLLERGFLTIDPPVLKIGPGPGVDDIEEIDQPPRISERGKGFICAMKEYETRLAELKRLSDSAERSADSAERRAKTAENLADSSARTAASSEELSRIAHRKASRADIKSIISLILAGIALLFEFAVNHSAITQFFKSLIP